MEDQPLVDCRVLHSILDEGREIDELHLSTLGARARLGSLPHDRTEGPGRDNGAPPRLPKLLEAHVADSRTWLLFLIGKQETAAGAAAERILAIPFRFLDVAAESHEQVPRFVHRSCVASEVAGIVKGHLARFRVLRLHVPQELVEKKSQGTDFS